MEIGLHILCIIIVAEQIYLLADQENDRFRFAENDYLPCKRRKLSKLFRFSNPDKPIQFRAYCRQRVAQIMVLLYLIILDVGRIFTHSFDFVFETPLLLYPIAMMVVGFLPSIGIWIYVQIRKYEDKKILNFISQTLQPIKKKGFEFSYGKRPLGGEFFLENFFNGVKITCGFEIRSRRKRYLVSILIKNKKKNMVILELYNNQYILNEEQLTGIERFCEEIRELHNQKIFFLYKYINELMPILYEFLDANLLDLSDR